MKQNIWNLQPGQIAITDEGNRLRLVKDMRKRALSGGTWAVRECVDIDTGKAHCFIRGILVEIVEETEHDPQP